MGKEKYIIGFLILVILTSSIYILLPDSVRIDVQKTKTIFRVYENESWVVSGIEYTNLYDGTKKMRAKNREIEYNILQDNKTEIIRTAYFKENITAIDTYLFDGGTKDIELFPIKHTIEIINGEDKILAYEVHKLLYNGETIKDLKSPQEFGHKMKVEWDDGNYYSKIYKYKDKEEGKLIIRYMIDSNNYIKNVRLFDPQQNNFSVSQDTYSRSDKPNNNYGTANSLWVGNETARSYLDFNLTDIHEYTTIFEATLKLYFYASPINETSDLSISVGKANQTWNETNLTWNNQPSTFDTSDTQIVNNNYGWIEFDVTDIVQDWMNGEEQYGFALIGYSDNVTLKKFYSSVNETYPPELFINYSNGEDPVVNIMSPENNTQQGTGDIIIAFNVSDESEIANCSLRVNKNQIVETKENIMRDRYQLFKITEDSEKSKNFDIVCTDIHGFVGVSDYYSIETNSSLSTIYGKVVGTGTTQGINTTINLYQDDELKYTSSSISNLNNGHAFVIEDGYYDAEIIFNESDVFDNITFENLSLFNNRIKVLDIQEDAEQGNLLNGMMPFKSYSIDPSDLSFNNANLNIKSATTSNLYKCKNWSFESQTCLDNNWTFYKTLAKGESYTIDIDSEDPGFSEYDEMNYRMNITIDSDYIDEELTNWTLIITHNASGMQDVNGVLDLDGTRPALNGGADLRFYQGNVRLGTDIRNFTLNNNPNLSEMEIAVRVINVSNITDTNITMYWGNNSVVSQPAVDAQYGQYDAYDEHYLLVLPLGDDPAEDRTVNGLDGTLSGVTSVSGKIGGAAKFDSSDYILTSDSAILDTGGEVTISSLFYNIGWTDGAAIALHDDSNYKYLLYNDDSGIIFYVRTSGGVHSTSAWKPSAGTWRYTAAVFDRSLASERLKLYGDGIQQESATGSDNDISAGDQGIQLGHWSRTMNGYLDEFRLSSNARSSSWLNAEYNNFFETTTMLITGDIEESEEEDTEFPQIYLTTPEDDAENTTDNTPDFVFNATDDIASSLSCVLYMNNGTTFGAGSNASVVNWTATTITANQTLANDNYDWWVNCSDGTNENKSEVRNLSINVAVGDSCTYSSGNWEVDCSDNCNIDSNVDLGGNDIIFSNSGTFTLAANITTIGKWEISDGCMIIVNEGYKFG